MIFDPMDLVGKLAALVPPPRFNLERIVGISCLPVMNSPRPLPHKLPIRTAYVNFGHPSLPIYRNPCYFTMDLRLKIEILHTPIMQSRLAANRMPKRGALSAG
jgi:hypothetical protein